MLAHMITPAELDAPARIMVDAGCQCVYMVDSAGALLPDDAKARVEPLLVEIGSEAQVGLHGHQNLYLGVANSLIAYQTAAGQIDGTLADRGDQGGHVEDEVGEARRRSRPQLSAMVRWAETSRRTCCGGA